MMKNGDILCTCDNTGGLNAGMYGCKKGKAVPL